MDILSLAKIAATKRELIGLPDEIQKILNSAPENYEKVVEIDEWLQKNGDNFRTIEKNEIDKFYSGIAKYFETTSIFKKPNILISILNLDVLSDGFFIDVYQFKIVFNNNLITILWRHGTRDQIGTPPPHIDNVDPNIYPVEWYMDWKEYKPEGLIYWKNF